MNAGDRVRLTADPGKTGVLTGEKRLIGSQTYLQVAFPEKTEYKLIHLLEVVPDQPDDIFRLIQESRFGRARDLRGSITHIRLSGRIANLIYSLNTTNTDYYPHQFKPVLNFLQSPSGSMLIADEVGLGKTIEAGLIWTELRSRFDYRRLVVVCPAMLRDKWKLELENKFGLTATIVNRKEMLEALKTSQDNPYQEIALIGSYQGLRPARGWREDDEVENPQNDLADFLLRSEEENPLIDLLVMDEAHYMRNPYQPTSDLGDLFNGVSAHSLLLSATPIHLRNRDLYQLMHLIDPETFQREADFEDILTANQPIVEALSQVLQGQVSVQDYLDQLRRANESPLLTGNRQLNVLLNNPPTEEELVSVENRVAIANELENINILGRAITRTRKRDVIENRVLRDPHRLHVEMNSYEAEFYDNVTDLVRRYAMEHSQLENFLMVTPQRQVSSSMAAALRSWKERYDEMMAVAYEDLGFDGNQGEIGPLVREFMMQAESLGDLEKLIEEDSKYNKLRELLTMHFKETPNEKVILFAYFKPTLRYLYDRLVGEGFVPVILSGDSKRSKTDIIESFRLSKTDQILLSTEVASEGVDLQFSRFMVNYDLPWNPMRVEQRIGRIDRIGQKAPKITIFNLFYQNTIDDRIYTRLFERLDIFRQALGDMEAVLGREIQKLTSELICEKLSPEQEEDMIKQTEIAVETLRKEEERLEENASSLIAHGEYILRQVTAARDMERTIGSQELVRYTQDFFYKHYKGSRFTQVHTSGDLLFDVELSPEAIFALQKYMRDNSLGLGSRFALANVTKIRCLFSNKVGGHESQKIERVNQWHSLVRFVADAIRSREEVFYPIVAVSVSSQVDSRMNPGEYFFFIAHWSTVGVRNIDHLFYQAINIETGEELSQDDSERLLTYASLHGSDKQIAVGDERTMIWSNLLDRCIVTAEGEFQKYVERLQRENDDRADIQRRSLERHREIQIARLREEIDRLEQQGKDKGAKLRRGKIDKLTHRVEQRILEIEENRNLRPDSSMVNAGIISVD